MHAELLIPTHDIRRLQGELSTHPWPLRRHVLGALEVICGLLQNGCRALALGVDAREQVCVDLGVLQVGPKIGNALGRGRLSLARK